MIQADKTYTNAAISHDASILTHIHTPEKNIAIYQRDTHMLSEELASIADQSVEFRASGSAAEILSQLDVYATDHLPECFALRADVAKLLSLFEGVTQTSSFRMMLATINSDMCRRFHADANDLRLLCTYIGPGTLWVPEEAIEHKSAQVLGRGHELVIDMQHVQQAGTGHVVILKGALYPDANPILHRSPTIEEQGEKRLLLRIDTNESLSF